MNKLEEQFYEQAARELASKSPVPGIMAKAYAEVDGDERRVYARYIALRVEHLLEERMPQADALQANAGEIFNAWRRTRQGKEDWIIRITQNGLQFVNSKTREEISLSPRGKDFLIEFRPFAWFHKIVLTNRRGDRFSFNAKSTTILLIQQLWNGML